MSAVLNMKADTRPEFQQQQLTFAAHIRNPEQHAKPQDVEERRMAIYRDLFYNNVEGIISNGFPVLRKLYNDNNWHRLVRGFFGTHRSKTPYFSKLPEEFLSYLEDEYQPQASDPDFLLELAHYEWVELALAIADEEVEFSDNHDDLLTGKPTLSPLAWLLHYRYPVHRISPDFYPEQAPEQPTSLVVYRARDDKVCFLELNPVSARLLQLISDHPGETAHTLLQQIAKELGHPNPDAVIAGGEQLLSDLINRNVLIV
ncbi:MAG: putative DNA-binding domain-containing protein [Chromatiales bacterium]|nr:putative DNA-binding domain-containing protein [Chromatiales bacterium]